MKKLVCVVLVVLMLTCCLAGCGGSGKADAKAAKSYDLAGVVGMLEDSNPIANPREIDDFSIANDFGFAEGLVAEYSGKISNDQGDSGMILALKAADGKGDELKTAADAYKADQEAFFGNYYEEFAEGMALIADGRVKQDGDYVFIVFASLSVGGYDAIDKALSSL